MTRIIPSAPLAALLLGVAAWLLSGAPALAHNGEVAFAAPAAGIVIDGDFADWPDAAIHYPILRLGLGVAPDNSTDFSGSFRVAWDPAHAALFVAVDIVDDDMHMAGGPITTWSQMREAFGRLGWRSRAGDSGPPDLPDGCAVIVDEGDGGNARRYSLDGNGTPSVFSARREQTSPAGGFESAQRLSDGHRLYEWRIVLTEPARGTKIGFDVTAVDRDSLGGLSWVTWGPGVGKVWNRGNHRGDLVLMPSPLVLHDISGDAVWTDSLALTSPHGVRLQSVDHGARWLTATDSSGYFSARLPEGRYTAALEDPRLGRDLSETAFVVGAESTTRLVVSDRPLFRMSALAPVPGGAPRQVHTRPNLPAGRQRGVSWVGSRIIGRDELAPLVPVYANWIVQTPFGWQSDIHKPTLRAPTGEAGLWGESDRGVAITAALARERGIATLLKPHLWTGRGTWRGELAMTTEEDWAEWFAQYEAFIVHFARLAEANGIEGLCIGAELGATLGREAEWRRVIQRVRREYGGWIVYAANWTHFEKVPFWDAVDYIGVQAYFPLAAEPTADVEKLMAGWQPWLDRMEAVATRADRRVLFTEIGYRSNANAAVEPWLWEQQTEGGGDSLGLQSQDALYEAFFRAAWSRDWVAGAYFWKWFPNHDSVGGAEDDGFTPQRKTAQQTLTRWYRSNLVAERRIAPAALAPGALGAD